MRLATPLRLHEIARFLGEAKVASWDDPPIAEIVDDSRRVKEDSLYISVAEPGDEGWRYVADAQRRGAVAVLLEPAALERYPTLAAASITVPDARLAMAVLALWANGDPASEMYTAGVTGTNGKTTTTHMLSAIFEAAGMAHGRIGTLGAEFLERQEKLGYTTPPPLVLQPLLRRMRTFGVTAVAMEVSSHALALKRVAGMQFSVALFTNLSRDHLDFHETMEAYVEAKRQLFRQADHGIFNLDDETGRLYFSEFGGTGYTLDPELAEYYRERGGRVLCPDGIVQSSASSKFYLGEMPYFLPLPGRFNISNALGAIIVGHRLDIPDALIAQGLLTMPGVPGRMERFAGDDCTAIVDYAHTPDALERVLEAARQTQPARLTVVFGCGGGRDAGKRPEMGAVAERLADRVILTTDNPRQEDAGAIIAEICAGMQSEPGIEPDRRAAIRTAIRDARPGEVVVVAGKGAETDQWIGIERIPFEDRIEVRAALHERDQKGDPAA